MKNPDREHSGYKPRKRSSEGVNPKLDDRETIALSTNPKFIELLEKSRSRRRAEGGISSAEMRHRLGLDRE